MTITDLTAYQIDNVGKQLTAAFVGASEAALTTKLTPEGMSGYEMLDHLGDCYSAMIQSTSGGGEYAWGSYKLPDGDFNSKWATLQDLRSKAKAAALGGSEDALKHAFDFISAHDAYHVGQMALLRLQHEPGWDPYSLYA